MLNRKADMKSQDKAMKSGKLLAMGIGLATLCASCVKDSSEAPESRLMKLDGTETHHKIEGQSVFNDALPRPPRLPEEFNVLPPAPKNSLVVSVEKFGASPGLSDNTKPFNDAIAYCKANGASKLIVPKGVYRFTEDRSVHFDGLSDFVFDGQGSSFIFHHKTGHFMEIDLCERVVFKDFSIDWDWRNDPLASFVRIDAVDKAGEYLDLLFVDYERFPVADVSLTGLVQIDEATMSAGVEKASALSFRSPRKEWLSTKLLRVYSDDKVECMKKAHFASMKPGGLFRALHRQMGIGAVIMGDNKDLTISGVSVYSTPGPAIVAWGTQSHWQMLDTKVTIPSGSGRPISSTSDHFDIHQTRGHFKMERCEFAYGFDDGINISGPASGLGTKGGERSILTSRIFNLDPYHPGDLIELRNDDYSPTGFAAKIKEIKTIDASKGIREFVFDERIPEPKGERFILFNKRCEVSDIVIRNCYFHDNQARGMLLHGERILVEGNKFFHNQLGSIHITTGYTLTDWTEGQGASDVTIRDNVIDSSNPCGAYVPEKMAVVKIYAFVKVDPSEEKTSYPVFKDILIEGNEFTNIPGAMAYVCSAKNVVFKDNTVKITRSRIENMPYCGSIATVCSSGIFAEGNKWLRSPYLGAPEIIAGAGASGINYRNNQTIDLSPSKAQGK